MIVETDRADIPNDCSVPAGPTSSYEMTTATSVSERGNMRYELTFLFLPSSATFFQAGTESGVLAQDVKMQSL